MLRIVTTLSKKFSMNIYLRPEDLSELVSIGYEIVDEGSVRAWVRMEPGGVILMRPGKREGFRKRSLNIKNDRRYVHACLGGPTENDLSPENYPAPWRLREAITEVSDQGLVTIRPPGADVGAENMPVVVPDFFGGASPMAEVVKIETAEPITEDHLFVVGAGPVTMEFKLPPGRAVALINFLDAMGVKVSVS